MGRGRGRELGGASGRTRARERPQASAPVPRGGREPLQRGATPLRPEEERRSPPQGILGSPPGIDANDTSLRKANRVSWLPKMEF